MSLDQTNQETPVSLRKPIANAHFAVEARLAIQLGRESISSSITAILELVKNSYDADATRVRIRFSGLGTDSAMMVIEDDGRGMTAEDMLNYWMVLGTTNKVKLRRAGSRRVLTGEKGLGRLGLDRLSRETVVESIVKDASEGIELPIDWTQFEQEDIRLENVSLKIFAIPNLSKDPITGRSHEYPFGTRLVLKGLKDTWIEGTLRGLREELSLLVSPFSTGADFRIELDSGLGLRSVDGVVETPVNLLQAAQWKVTASIDEQGFVQMRMASAHHNKVYEEGPLPWENRFPGWGAKPHCGPLKFEFHSHPIGN
jgi:hypothetical protein